jgi:hypothetical protein
MFVWNTISNCMKQFVEKSTQNQVRDQLVETLEHVIFE